MVSADFILKFINQFMTDMETKDWTKSLDNAITINDAFGEDNTKLKKFRTQFLRFKKIQRILKDENNK